VCGRDYRGRRGVKVVDWSANVVPFLVISFAYLISARWQKFYPHENSGRGLTLRATGCFPAGEMSILC